MDDFFCSPGPVGPGQPFYTGFSFIARAFRRRKIHQTQQILHPVPGVKLGQGIFPDDEIDVRVRPHFLHNIYGIVGIGQAAPVKFQTADHKVFILLDCQFHHGQPVLPGRKVRPFLLMGRNVSRQKHHFVKFQLPLYRMRHAQMSHMDRVKGPTHDRQPFHGPASLFLYC